MITTISTLPAPVQQVFDSKLLSVRTPNLVHKLGAILKVMPSKSGRTLRQRRYERLPITTVPLGIDGSPVPAITPNVVDIDATISLYGQYIAVNQLVTLTNQDPVLNELANLLGLSLRMSEDALMRDMLAASASVVNCTGGVNGDLPTNIALSDIHSIVATLKGNDGWMISDRIEAEDKFGTAPVRNAYLAMAHTGLIPSLESINGWIPQWNYPNGNATISSEWGSVGNVRFFLSSVGSVAPNASMFGNDIYNVFISALEAYCNIELDNFSARYIYRPPIYSDPLMQNSTVGMTFAQVPRILNDLWLYNLRATA